MHVNSNAEVYFILFFCTLAYLFGSIPFGKLVGKFYGIDIQKHGSGNIGFANVVRVLGWRAGLIVLIGDISKGLLPVIFAKPHLNSYEILAVALAAVLGHIFPIWLRFRGGKGVATGLGVTLAISPLLGACGLAVYLLGFITFRKSAQSSLTAIWCLPLLSLVILRQYALFYFGLALLGTWAHRHNIQEMIRVTADAGD